MSATEDIPCGSTAEPQTSVPCLEEGAHDVDPNRSFRVAILMNKNLEPGVALNAIAHLGMAVANACGEEGRVSLKFLDFVDRNGQIHPSISARALIVLRGKVSELRRLREEAIAAGVLVIDFTSTMTGGTYEEQLERTAITPEETLEYFGVAVLGRAETISRLTKRYSLWR